MPSAKASHIGKSHQPKRVKELHNSNFFKIRTKANPFKSYLQRKFRIGEKHQLSVCPLPELFFCFPISDQIQGYIHISVVFFP